MSSSSDLEFLICPDFRDRKGQWNQRRLIYIKCGEIKLTPSTASGAAHVLGR